MSAEHIIINSLNRLLKEPTKELFEEINVYLSNIPLQKVARIADVLKLDVYIDELLQNFSNDELLPDLSQLLTRFLQSLPPERVLSDFRTQLIYALQHPASTVKLIALREVLQCAEQCSKELVEDNNLVSEVITQLGNNDLKVASVAGDILHLIGSRDNKNLGTLCQPLYSKMFKKLLHNNDLVKFRVFELMVKIALQSKAALGEVSEFLELMVHEIDSQDPLAALNAIELVTRLSLSEHGAEFLHSLSVSQKLQAKVFSEDDPTINLLLPSLLKYFGKLGYQKPLYLSTNFPKILEVMLKSVEDQKMDVGRRTAAIDCLSMVGTSLEGKKVLAGIGPLFHPTLQALGALADTGPEDMKIEALIAIAHLFKLQPEEIQRETSLAGVMEEWYQVSHPNLMEPLVRTCRVPFPEMRNAALLVVESLASLAWGQSKMAAQPGFLEFLLDRRSEHSKEGHERRYSIVSTLVNSPSLSSSFDEDMVQRLEQYHREGPFFVRTQAAVAMEGAN